MVTSAGETSVVTSAETSAEASAETSAEASAEASAETSVHPSVAPSAVTSVETSVHPSTEPSAHAHAQVQATPLEEATVLTEVTPEATESVEESDGDNPLTEVDLAGDGDTRMGEDPKERNQEIILAKIGSLTCANGEELRIILSRQHNKQYITIRDTCMLYSDLKDVVNAFDTMIQMEKQAKKLAQIREIHRMYARFSAILCAALTYSYIVIQLTR